MEIFAIDFYVDAQGEEGVSFDAGFNEGVVMWSDAWAANESAEKGGYFTPEPGEQPAALIGHQQASVQELVMLC